MPVQHRPQAVPVRCAWRFNSAGLEVREYAYYDAANHSLDFDGLLASLSEAQSGDVVLFHGCCHNPTGIDPTLEQCIRS